MARSWIARAMFLLCPVVSLHAATVAVTKTTDNLAGSLRQAIQDANAGDTIVFQIPTTDPGYNSTANFSRSA